MQSTVKLNAGAPTNKNYKSAAISLPWTQSLRFRTRVRAGLVLETQFRSSSSVLEVSDIVETKRAGIT